MKTTNKRLLLILWHLKKMVMKIVKIISYIYNQKQGRPISFATLRISTHAPNLRNYMNPYITKFHYPSPIDGLNVSIEFYN